ncbi:transmembrane protein [Stenotrophomonas maltophilia AU12-09]|nr:transmembrane protein [Stenotrophomonas maltophilia AU12-09]
MAGTELVAVKYAACAEFDPSSGQCTTVVWVDAPSPIPPLTAEQGAALGGATLLVWAGVIAMVLIRKGARLER